MIAKIVAGLLVSAGLGISGLAWAATGPGSAASNAPGAESCYPGAPCCYPGSPCCPGPCCGEQK